MAGFELVDRGDRGQQGFDLALVLRSEDFGQKGINHEVVSFRRENPNYYFTLLKMTAARPEYERAYSIVGQVGNRLATWCAGKNRQ